MGKTFEFDGNEIEFKALDVNDMIILEEKYGGLQDMVKESRPLTLAESRTLVWLLVRKQTKLTEEEVGARMIPTAESFEILMDSINAAVAGEAAEKK